MTQHSFKNILVPFDFTHGALNALKIADKFAVDFNSRIHLVNIVEPSVSYCPYGSAVWDLRAGGRFTERSIEVLEKYLDLNSLNPGAYSYDVEYGFCSGTLIDLHLKHQYDLIIVPDDTKNFMSQIVSKYNPLKIIEKARAPVIAVNKYYRTVDFRNIILPIRNLVNWFDKIPFMISLAQHCGGKIHTVGLSDGELANSLQFHSIFDHAISILQRQNVLGSVRKFDSKRNVRELIQFSQVKKGDLIALTPPKNYGLLRSIINPSMYSRLIANSPAPIFGT